MILTDNESKVLDETYQKRGRKNQLLKAIEELGELTRAIARRLSSEYEHEDVDNLAEEVVDVYITLEYVKKEVPNEMLLATKKKKIDRMRKKNRLIDLQTA